MTIGSNAKYMTFDCYGTLINFEITSAMRRVFGERMTGERGERFIAAARAYRFDECLGPWKPYRDVVKDATRRAAKAADVEYRDSDGDQLYEAIGTWGPHPDVPEALRALATRYPLVILSNAADDQIPANVARLGAPFHKVLTAQQAQAYKPRFAAFEYMFDALGCRPEEIIHVSSSVKYDNRPAAELGIGTRIYVDRGHDVPAPWLGYHAIKDLSELPALLGIERTVAVG